MFNSPFTKNVSWHNSRGTIIVVPTPYHMTPLTVTQVAALIQHNLMIPNVWHVHKTQPYFPGWHGPTHNNLNQGSLFERLQPASTYELCPKPIYMIRNCDDVGSLSCLWAQLNSTGTRVETMGRQGIRVCVLGQILSDMDGSNNYACIRTHFRKMEPSAL